MKSIKNFKTMNIDSSISNVVGGAKPTGNSCIGYDRLKRNGITITNTRDWNPFNNDRKGVRRGLANIETSIGDSESAGSALS